MAQGVISDRVAADLRRGDERPGVQDRPGLSSVRSLRAQAAAVFLVLVLFISGLLWTIAAATREHDVIFEVQTRLLTWQNDTSQISLNAETLRTNLALFNNALLDGNQAGADASRASADANIKTINSYLDAIDALGLPQDALETALEYHRAAQAFTSFGVQFLAAGKHSDQDMLAEVGTAMDGWRAEAAQVAPRITKLVNDNALRQDRQLNWVNQVLWGGAIGSVILILLLAFIQLRLTLQPIVRLSALAERLAAGHSATIPHSTRRDEIGQLSTALASWQTTSLNLIAGLTEASSKAAASASKLSSAAEQLAAATAEQTSAATETSASMEELARTSTSIAETLERVAHQAQETRTNLEQAQADTLASGERTLALAERVGDINQILSLINEIADQTNLLALNAAIEAARAGDAGRGFAVVADEVRRLAERSKSSSAKIATIIQSAQSESNATVMAMEQSSKQMEHGLALLAAVTEASDQVKLITQQQRTATEQVVEAMEQITVGSRQVATTAQEISAAAANNAALATEMEGMSRSRLQQA
jgi:methyl-accepting chemotaxis protein